MLSLLHKTVAGLAALVLLTTPALSLAQDSASEWKFTLTPYLWLAKIEGTARYTLPSGATDQLDVKVDADDLLDAANFAATVSGEVRRGRLAIFGDFVYLSLSTDNSRVQSVTRNFSGPFGLVTIPVSATADLSTSTDADLLIINAGASWTVIDTPAAVVDILGGVRWLSLETETKFRLNGAIAGPGPGIALARTGTIESDTDIVDAIAGVRGVFRLGSSNWSVPFYVDAGTGDSDLTWQVFGAVRYAFDWGEVNAGYRHLEYDQDDDKFLQDFSFSGPVLGASFRF